MKLDAYEKEILRAFENDELKPVANFEAEKKRLMEAAANTYRKDKRVNIRISTPDLRAIQVKAMQEGLPYQTLISSLIHKFVSGQLQQV